MDGVHNLYRLVSLAGLVVMLLLAWAMSENRRAVRWRVVGWGLGLQFSFALLLLSPAIQGHFFEGMARIVNVVTSSALAGARFVFGDALVVGDPASGEMPLGGALAFQALPVIVFVCAVSAVLYHLGIIQLVVRAISCIMQRTLRTSGAETFGTALLIFLGIESLAAVRGYLVNMTRSELCTLMTAFMATIAGSVMVIYASVFGASPGHLAAASLMSAPAAILISKLMVPETGVPETGDNRCIVAEVETYNVIDAAARGTADGLRIAAYVGATLIAFVGLIYLLNLGLEAATRPLLAHLYTPWAGTHGWPVKEAISFNDIMGLAMYPFALLLGVPVGDAFAVGQLLGTKTIVNEFLAYEQMAGMKQNLSPRAFMLATYALCGFANPGSLGICIAAMNGFVPERRKDIAQLGLKAFIGGTLACFTTACIAGIILYE